MATYSSTLAWKIPWTEEPGRLQSMGSLRVGHDWVTSFSLCTFMHWRRKWQPTPVFLPGESQGQGSLVGCHNRVSKSGIRLKWLSSSSSRVKWGVQRLNKNRMSSETATHRRLATRLIFIRDGDLLTWRTWIKCLVFALQILTWLILWIQIWNTDYQVGPVLENKSKMSFSSKWPELTSKNGALFTWPRKRHKIVQIKGSILVFTLRTLVKSLRPLEACISKKPPSIWRTSR